MMKKLLVASMAGLLLTACTTTDPVTGEVRSNRAGTGAIIGALGGAAAAIAICGDGGFLMNVQELETAHRLGLPFVVLVWTDGGYGLIEMHQRRKFHKVAGTRFDNPDFVQLAQAFGCEGLRVERAGQLPGVLAQALAARGPVIVDIPVDYAENEKLGIDLWKLAPEAWPSL